MTPLFPGPKFVGPQAERYRSAGVSPDASVDYCSGCGICTQVCPHDVKIAEINSQARAQMWEEQGIPLRNQLIARPSVLGRLGTPVAPLANWALRKPLAGARPPPARHPPQGAACRGSRAGRSSAGRGATAARPADGRRLLPRLRHQLLRAGSRRDGGRRPRAQRLPSGGPASRTAAGCRCSRTASSTARGATSGGLSPISRRTPARACRSWRTRRAAA